MDTRQIRQEGKHKPEDSVEVLLNEYSAFQTRYQHLWDMRLKWITGIATIVAGGLVWGLYYEVYVIIAALPLVLALGAGVVVTLELFLRQDGLYLKHIENKVNRVVQLELLQYYTKYSTILSGIQHRVLGQIPKSLMSILYVTFLPLFYGLWGLIIWLAMTNYITPMWPNWKGVLVLVMYIVWFVVPASILLFGFRFIDNKFNYIIKQDKMWYTNKEKENRG